MAVDRMMLKCDHCGEKYTLAKKYYEWYEYNDSEKSLDEFFDAHTHITDQVSPHFSMVLESEE